VAILALCEVWPESPVSARACSPSVLQGGHDAFSFATVLRLAASGGPRRRSRERSRCSSPASDEFMMRI